jgi:uncharacterized oligopeptide transporter (OPT) family protein
VVAPNPLPAPQATLISALAQGVIGGSLEWKMIGIGAFVGVGLILLDTLLGAMRKIRIPPLLVDVAALQSCAVIKEWHKSFSTCV